MFRGSLFSFMLSGKVSKASTFHSISVLHYAVSDSPAAFKDCPFLHNSVCKCET